MEALTRPLIENNVTAKISGCQSGQCGSHSRSLGRVGKKYEKVSRRKKFGSALSPSWLNRVALLDLAADQSLGANWSLHQLGSRYLSRVMSHDPYCSISDTDVNNWWRHRLYHVTRLLNCVHYDVVGQSVNICVWSVYITVARPWTRADRTKIYRVTKWKPVIFPETITVKYIRIFTLRSYVNYHFLNSTHEILRREHFIINCNRFFSTCGHWYSTDCLEIPLEGLSWKFPKTPCVI